MHFFAPDPQERSLTRRELFAVVAGALSFLFTLPFPLRRKKDLGELPGEEGTFFREGFWVIRRAGRVGICEGLCPHWGCRIQPVLEGFRCPCHGSRFDPLGRYQEGPARRSLFWFPPLIRQGRIYALLDPETDPVWRALP